MEINYVYKKIKNTQNISNLHYYIVILQLKKNTLTLLKIRIHEKVIFRKHIRYAFRSAGTSPNAC
ncbi:hypothetical protein FACS18945_4250 [Bacteroidia bacterium]|nr:hypothetical protein FACS18945_4250 [Bacteroidia bacterium]